MLSTISVMSPLSDSHRQRIINWIDGTGQLSTAFDFTTKGILQVLWIKMVIAIEQLDIGLNVIHCMISLVGAYKLLKTL